MVGWPLDALAGVEWRGLAVDAEEAFALEADDADGVFGWVLVDGAVRAKPEQRQQQLKTAQQHLAEDTVAAGPRQLEPVWAWHRLGRDSHYL